MKDRILSLLGTGFKPSLVASAVGCSESYISQLLSQDQFALDVANLRCKDLEGLQERDKRWDRLEDLLLKKLEDLIPFMLRPREVLHALQIVNTAKRRTESLVSDQHIQHITQNIVVLTLPQKTINQFELSANNEIISVEGKALIPMATSSLLKELEQKKEGKDKEVLPYERVPRKEIEEDRREISIPERIQERIALAESV